jgi:hypothetical protein
MIPIPLRSDDIVLQLAPAWPGWTLRAQVVVLTLLFLVPALGILYFTRHERRLLSRGRAVLFAAIRLAVLSVVWALVALQPSLQNMRTQPRVSRVLIAVDASMSMQVADPQRNRDEKESLAHALGLREDGIADLTRADLARLVLEADGLDLKAKLGRRHEIDQVFFHRKLWPQGDPAPASGAEATDLSLPLDRVWRRRDIGRWSAIVLLTDGQSNEGQDPKPIAKKLGQTRIPVFPIALGGKDPPLDVAIVEVKPSSPQIPKGAEAEVRVAVRFHGVPARDFTLQLHVPGNKKPAETQTQDIIHDGRDGVVTKVFPIKLDDVGLRRLEATVKPRAGTLREITTDNNHFAGLVRVGQDKLRVLLVDEDARWEHHYLGAALARDEDVHLHRILFAAPRLGLAKSDEHEKLGLASDRLPALDPKQEDPLWSYDVILLGDIPPERLPLADRQRLENYVAQRGGMLVVLAGKRWMPLAFGADPTDPLVKLLPVAQLDVFKPNEGFPLHVTEDGKRMPYFQIEDPRRVFGEIAKQSPEEFWAKMPKHYWALAGEPKSGALVLAALPHAKKALVALHTVGFGKVLFMGIDSTWRWRYAVGDVFHHSFWGQLVRWAGIDPWHAAGNHLVRHGVKDSLLEYGQEGTAIVRLGKDAPSLDPAAARVHIVRLRNDGTEEIAENLALKSQEQRGRHYEAKIPSLAPGNYRVDLAIPELAGKVALSDDEKKTRRDLFTVLPPRTREMQELAVDWDLLRDLAGQSGGRVLTPQSAEEIVSLLDRQTQTEASLPAPLPFWRHPALPWLLFGALLGLLSLEWLTRKLAGLP